ncbi:MAG: tetratricopeptide repeat protein, partial [Gammaproteobacteria bacterium]
MMHRPQTLIADPRIVEPRRPRPPRAHQHRGHEHRARPLLVMRLFLLLLLSSCVTPTAWAVDSNAELDRARSMLERGQLDSALKAIDGVLSKQPDDLGARLLKGVILAQKGLLGDATRIFQSITEDRPDLPQPFNNLAAIQASQGRYDEALTTLHKVVTLHPGYAIGHENLGDLHSSLAQRSYQNALGISGPSPRLQAKMEALSGFVATPARNSEPSGPGRAGQSPAKRGSTKPSPKIP